MIKIPFTEADIEACFDEADLRRGRTYWRQGAVQSLAIEEDGHLLTALVQGTQRKPYKVLVSIEPGYRGQPEINTDCSCPVGFDCKHAAAVCLAALASQPQTGPQLPIKAAVTGDRTVSMPAPGSAYRADDAWDKWLDDLAEIESGAPEQGGKECILYILTIEDNKWHAPPARRLLIKPVISRLLKTGGYGPPRQATPYQIQGHAKYSKPDDKKIAELIQGASHTYSYPTEFRAPPDDPDIFDLVMHRVIATERCFLGTLEGDPLTPGDGKPARLDWHVEPDGAQSPAIVTDDASSQLVILPGARPWYVDTITKQAGPLQFETPLAVVHKFLAGPRLSPDTVAALARKLAARDLPVNIVAPRSIQLEKRDAVPPIPCLRLMTFTTDANTARSWDDIDRIHHLALPHFDYDGMIVDQYNAPDVVRRQSDDRLIVMRRHQQAEAGFIRDLTSIAGLAPASVRPPGFSPTCFVYAFAYGPQNRLHWLDFLHNDVPALRDKGWRVVIDDNFAARFQTIEVDAGDESWEADLKEKEGSAWWFSLDLGIMVEGQRVALLPLLVQALKRLPEPSIAAIESLALSGRLYVDLPDGRTLALPFERVRDIVTTLIELYDRPLNPDGSLTVPLDLATALGRIDAVTRMRWLGEERLRALIERLKTFAGLTEIAPPRGLQATLRPYQRDGLNWLQFLREYDLAGILADDMGLGKTIQTLAHVLVEKETGRLSGPCLIVCPTSLIPNWQDEAAKFAPALKVLSLHGKDRALRFGDIAAADLVLTTYPLLPRDAETLLPVEWHMAVLDEAQAIKNPATQATQLACELKARHRLCLTGTPIENHLGEVWSQFAFLMPGMLDTHKEFTRRFRVPIEKQKNTDRQVLLARRLKPFILRRHKADVAKELPPKTEMVHYVEFDAAQRDLYETVRLTMHQKVQQAVEDKGFNRSRIVILDALLKLRQTCCDPRLVKLTSMKKVKHSAKLESLMDMLPEMIDEGRRILLFSQFTSMLDLIKPELDKAKIPFVEIRGDTVDRKTPVATFQSGAVPLFLISLKAGGTGLNLTAADTVIHYDPWWNPAVEAQATDRAHRIGQDKPVFVYKFIAKGTVEERILDLQNRKRGLAAALTSARSDAATVFEASDLDFLFQEAA